MIAKFGEPDKSVFGNAPHAVRREWRMDAITEPHALGVADAAYSRLRSDILGGELLPGMKLKLDALRERYDVSVNTLRETLSRLAADGLVEAEGRRDVARVPARPA